MSKDTSAAKRSLFGFLGNLPVKAKTMAGFAAVLVLFAIVGAISYSSLQSIDQSFVTYENRVAVVDIARDIDADFTAVRVAVRRFIQSGEEADAQAVEDAAAKVHEHVARGLETSVNPERQAMLGEIETNLNTYIAGFERLVTIKHEEDTLLAETLNPTGVGLATDLKKVRDDAAKAGNSNALILATTALQEIMEVRIDVLKALGGHDEEAAARVEEELADVETVIAGLDKAVAGTALAADVEPIDAEIVTYHEAFTRLYEIDQEVTALADGEMKTEAEELGAIATKIVESGSADRDTLQNEAAAEMANTSRLVVIMLLGGLGLGLGLAWMIGNGIAKPIRRSVDVIGELANGNLAVEVFGVGRKDEIGAIANGLQVFKDNMIRAKKLEEDSKAAEIKAAQDRRAAMLTLADSFEAGVGGIISVVAAASTELQTNAQSMSATAEETNRQASAVAAASEQATVNVQTVASASEELSASIAEIGRQVAQSASIASMAVDEAKKTDATVQGLSEAAQKIGEVVSLISDIASQTNLLALNATIEAARAGEAGKGFAVVASEVKSLANQTAKATEEIAAQIGAIQGSTNEAVGAIQSIGKTIGEINDIAAAISAAVEEQGAATREIARNVQEASQGTTEVSKNIGGVTQAAGETGSAANQVLSAADELSTQSEKLKSEVANFLQTVRAA